MSVPARVVYHRDEVLPCFNPELATDADVYMDDDRNSNCYMLTQKTENHSELAFIYTMHCILVGTLSVHLGPTHAFYRVYICAIITRDGVKFRGSLHPAQLAKIEEVSERAYPTEKKVQWKTVGLSLTQITFILTSILTIIPFDTPFFPELEFEFIYIVETSFYAIATAVAMTGLDSYHSFKLVSNAMIIKRFVANVLRCMCMAKVAEILLQLVVVHLVGYQPDFPLYMLIIAQAIMDILYLFY